MNRHATFTKPSQRIAARRAAIAQRAILGKTGGVIDQLRHIRSAAAALDDKLSYTLDWAVQCVGIDTAELLMHQRGEIRVMRGLLRECSNVLDTIDDDAGVRNLTRRVDRAVADQLHSELMLTNR